MKSAVQRFRYAATGRWAVSIRTYLAMVFPFGYLTSIEREQQLHNISVSHAAGIALGGELVCALYLFIAQALLLGNRKNQLQPLWRVVFVWISAGLIRGVFTACNARWGSGYDFDFGQRVPAAAIYTALAMALTAFYFGTIDRRRIEGRALRTLEGVLEQEESQLTELQRQRRQQVQQVFEGQLLPQVGALRSGIEKLLSAPAVDEGSVQKLFVQSQGISQSLEKQAAELRDNPLSKRTESQYSENFSYLAALLPKILSIRITFLLMLLGSFSGQFVRNGLKGALAGFVGAFVVIAYLLPISQALKRTTFNRPLLYTLAYPGAFLVQGGYNLIQPQIGFVLSHPYQPWYSGLKTMYGVYVASIIATLVVSVEGSFSRHSESGLKLRNKISVLTSDNHSLEKNIAEAQYGTLQGKITGVTMALHLMSTMDSISQARKTELLVGANALLDESLREIESLQGGLR